jgi:hypothetical protein
MSQTISSNRKLAGDEIHRGAFHKLKIITLIKCAKLAKKVKNQKITVEYRRYERGELPNSHMRTQNNLEYYLSNETFTSKIHPRWNQQHDVKNRKLDQKNAVQQLLGNTLAPGKVASSP